MSILSKHFPDNSTHYPLPKGDPYKTCAECGEKFPCKIVRVFKRLEELERQLIGCKCSSTVDSLL